MKKLMIFSVATLAATMMFAQEAENRMHTIKALFVSALCDRKSV